jgi:plasmid stabilization system protein ParE
VSDAEVAFHPEAADEFGEAFAWYAARNERIAARFEREVGMALERIVETPNRWPTCDDVHRRLILRRFPCLVIDREHGGRIWIVAVAHAHGGRAAGGHASLVHERRMC